MKKSVLALAAVCVAAWVAPAGAAEFGYGGFMRYRGIFGNPGTTGVGVGNPAAVGTNDDDSATIWEYRVRQFFNLKVNDHVTTNVKLEWNSQFGDEQQIAGGSGDLQFGGTPVTTNSEVQFRIKNAFVRFDVPGAPLTLTVGQQDFSTPKALISVEDGTGIKAALKAAGGEHTLFWQRNTRGANNQTGADDGDWFGFVPSFNVGDLKISPHLSYFTTGGSIGNAGLRDAEILFFGVDSSGKFGPVGFTADLIFQNGRAGVGGLSPTSRQSLFSYIADVSLSLAAGPGTLTVKGLYSPGDDTPDNEADEWVNVIATDMGWSPFFHDGSSNSNFAGSVTPGLDTGGIMAAGIEFALSPVKNLTVTPNAYYLMAAEDINVAGGTELDDFYGIEAGVQANWRIWDSVALLGQFDYLFAGDVFKPATGDPKDAWRVIVGPSLSW